MRPFSCGRRQIWPFPGPFESLRTEKFKKRAQADVVGGTMSPVRKAKTEIPVILTAVLVKPI